MAKLALLLSLAIVLSLGQLSLCQPDCSALDVDFTGAATSGSSLPVCTLDDLQCCTDEYITRIRERVRQELVRGLREEFEDTVEVFQRIVGEVTEYLSTDFTTDFVMNLPGVSLFGDPDALNEVVEELEDNFIIQSDDSFSTDAFLDDLLMQFEAQVGAATDNSQLECIIRVTSDHINRAIFDIISTNLQILREAVTTSTRILTFLQNFNVTLGGFEPLPECVDTIVRFSFCGRCTDSIPPLCTNVCGAILRGCFAGFYTGVGDVFRERLWFIASQIVSLADTTLASVYDLESDIIDDFVQLVSDLGTECGINFGIPDIPGIPGRKRREDFTNSAFRDFAEALEELDGAFEYDSEGPEFCTEREDDECDDDFICTAETNCWNGNQMIARDIVAFTGNSIEEQASNPVYVPNTEDLMRQARALSQEVDIFIESDAFTSTAPDGVDTGGGAGATVAVLCTVLLSALLAVVL